MTPNFCRVRHDPAGGTYGDCLRACIATVLDLDGETIPHFADGGVSGDEAMARLRKWLAPDLAPFIVAYPGDIALAELLEMQRLINPVSVYVLFGGAHGGGDHCVVGIGGQIVHNPAWVGSEIVGPLSNGTWQLLVLGRV